MTGALNATFVILALPTATAALLAALPSYRLSAALNVASSLDHVFRLGVAARRRPAAERLHSDR